MKAERQPGAIVRAARILNPIAAAAVLVIVAVQLYLIAEYVFGDAGALGAHRTVGGIAPVVEAVAAVAGLVGWWRDRVQSGLSAGLFVVGVLQVSFAQNLGNSPAVHAFHGLLALAVVWLAAHVAVRKRAAVLRPAAAAR